MAKINYGIQERLDPVRMDTQKVEVQEEVLTKLASVVHTLEEAIEELRKVTLGTGLITGIDLDEEVS